MKKLLVLTFISAMCCFVLFTSCGGKQADAVAGKWKFVVNDDPQGNCEFSNGRITEEGSNRNLGTYTVVDERNVKINLVGVRNPTDSMSVDAAVSKDSITANFQGNQMKWEKVK